MASTGERIAERRKAAGLTHKSLAEQAGIPFSTLTKIEQGVIAAPKLVDVAAIAAVLGGTCADFLPTDAPSPPPVPRGRPSKRK